MAIIRDGEWHETSCGGRYRTLAFQERTDCEGFDELRQVITEPFAGYLVVRRRYNPALPHITDETMWRYPERMFADAIERCADLMEVTAPEVKRAVDLVRVTCSRWALADCAISQ